MVGSRRLTVPRIAVQHDALDGVLQSGMLVPAGDLVSHTLPITPHVRKDRPNCGSQDGRNMTMCAVPEGGKVTDLIAAP